MNDTHIHPDFQHILALSDEERLAFLDMPRWIGYERAKKILDTLHGLMQKPLKPRMRNLLLVGESNNGKTTLIERFFELQGKGYVNEKTEAVKPVIIAQSPPSADEKALYIALLEEFFVPYSMNDNKAKLRYQVIRTFRQCNVRLLIIDEMHSLLTGSAIKQREVMNAIKLLCNELAIPVVGVGTRDAVNVLHTDPQHASRFDVISLPSWELNSEFQRLLASFAKVLPLKKPSLLHQPDIATQLHVISRGNIGDLHRLLIECATHAIKSGKETIDMDVIKQFSWVKPTQGIREICF